MLYKKYIKNKLYKENCVNMASIIIIWKLNLNTTKH